jgi:hypothetical protein
MFVGVEIQVLHLGTRVITMTARDHSTEFLAYLFSLQIHKTFRISFIRKSSFQTTGSGEGENIFPCDRVCEENLNMRQTTCVIRVIIAFYNKTWNFGSVYYCVLFLREVNTNIYYLHILRWYTVFTDESLETTTEALEHFARLMSVAVAWMKEAVWMLLCYSLRTS